MLLEQAALDLVLDVADRERADADRLAGCRRGERHAVVHRADPGDPRRRHGVDVGGDEQRARLAEHRFGARPLRPALAAAMRTSARAISVGAEPASIRTACTLKP